MIAGDNGRALIAAAITPLSADFACDAGKLAEHCGGVLAGGCDGVALFGTSGEGHAFTADERIAALDRLLALGLPPQRVMFGAASSVVDESARLARHAVDAGCPDVLLMPLACPPGVTDDGLLAYYARVIERAARPELRLCLYNLPAVSGATIGPELVARLVERFPAVIAGYKDSSCDWAFTRRILDSFPELRVFSGYEPHLPRLLAAGGAGTICGVANVAPALMAELLADPREDGTALQSVSALVRVIEGFPVVPALKALAAARSGDPTLARVRPPLAPLTPVQAGELTAAAAALFPEPASA